MGRRRCTENRGPSSLSRKIVMFLGSLLSRRLSLTTRTRPPRRRSSSSVIVVVLLRLSSAFTGSQSPKLPADEAEAYSHHAVLWGQMARTHIAPQYIASWIITLPKTWSPVPTACVCAVDLNPTNARAKAKSVGLCLPEHSREKRPQDTSHSLFHGRNGG